MNHANKITLGICGLATLTLMSGCAVRPYGGVVFESPPPAVEVGVVVPDDYFWDGYEYVGFVGGQYYYLGPGNVWRLCEPFRVARFHEWERVHPDWRVRAIRNDRYRRGAYRHEPPRHEQPDRDHRHDHDDHDDHGH